MLSFSNNEFVNCKDIYPQLPEILKCMRMKPTQTKIGSREIISDDIELLDWKQCLSQPPL